MTGRHDEKRAFFFFFGIITLPFFSNPGRHAIIISSLSRAHSWVVFVEESRSLWRKFPVARSLLPVLCCAVCLSLNSLEVRLPKVIGRCHDASGRVLTWQITSGLVLFFCHINISERRQGRPQQRNCQQQKKAKRTRCVCRVCVISVSVCFHISLLVFGCPWGFSAAMTAYMYVASERRGFVLLFFILACALCCVNKYCSARRSHLSCYFSLFSLT